MLGAHIPQCDTNGNFNSRQVQGSTGYTWCVNQDGVEITNTRTGPGQTPIDCDNVPACLLSLFSATESGSGSLPQCEADGSYSLTQCSASTGACWCVNDGGVEVTSTRSRPGETRLNCTTIPCLRQAFDISQGVIVGSSIPQCETDGSYSARQCGPTGECWCVVPNTGVQIASTVRDAQDVQINCLDLPQCLQSLTSSSGLLGAYRPQCDSDGNYKSRQCHGSTGTCWCVDSTGTEILGTRGITASNSYDCDTVPSCLMMRHSDSGLLGSFTPSCNANGEFYPQQCHGSSGNCWCVNQAGSEITGTRTSPGEIPFDCDHVPLCLQQRTGTARKFGAIGAFRPKCEEDGSFSARQCSGSTGYCWCVSNTGVEIEGSRRAPGEYSISYDCSEYQEKTPSSTFGSPAAMGVLALGGIGVVGAGVFLFYRRRKVARSIVQKSDRDLSHTPLCEVSPM